MAYHFFDQDVYGLSDERIRQAAPSVFAQHAHESRSSRYTFIPTSDVLVALREAGFAVTTVMQSKSRDEDRRGFTKHLLRLRKIDDLGSARPDVHEIILRNAHAGESAYQLLEGVFRMVCRNGLISGDYSTESIRHSGGAVGRVVESTLRIVEDREEIMEKVEEMKAIKLSRPEQLLLAQYTLNARFDIDPEQEALKDPAERKLIPYTPQQFLRVRRREDAEPTLYNTMNIVQENAIRGGIRSIDPKGDIHKTREVRGIDQTVKVNKLVWSFTEELRKLHSVN